MRRIIPMLAVLLACASASAENVITQAGIDRSAPAIKLDREQALRIIADVPQAAPPRSNHPEAQRIAGKLDAHVAGFLAGYPYRPFHNVLGISGFETLFDHPDRLVYSLSLALPYLTEPTAARTRALLRELLEKHPPFGVAGLPAQGAVREAYAVPEGYRRKSGNAISAFGVYSFWMYIHISGDSATASSHWPAVRERVQPLLAQDYPFDPAGRKYVRDEARKLNGDLAGLIGFVRLARMNADSAAEAQGIARATQLLELRVNLERINTNILEKTQSGSKNLHNARLARYCDLVPEVALALTRHTDGLAAARLGAFRAERNAWYLAFGERMIGGENYISPAHMSHAMFNGAALVESLGAPALWSFIDIPWCKGDLYFIEKCAVALRAGQ
jgi:hypothetical protein